jgi:hypothetical protein
LYRKRILPPCPLNFHSTDNNYLFRHETGLELRTNWQFNRLTNQYPDLGWTGNPKCKKSVKYRCGLCDIWISDCMNYILVGEQVVIASYNGSIMGLTFEFPLYVSPSELTLIWADFQVEPSRIHSFKVSHGGKIKV